MSAGGWRENQCQAAVAAAAAPAAAALAATVRQLHQQDSGDTRGHTAVHYAVLRIRLQDSVPVLLSPPAFIAYAAPTACGSCVASGDETV